MGRTGRHRILHRVTQLLENIDWHRFLGRPPLPTASDDSISSLRRHPILITGAGGSVGSALALRLNAFGCETILLESGEANLYELQNGLSADGGKASFYLGNAGDAALLDEIFAVHRPRLVYHTAAFKHVTLLEEQPFAAIANNIFATRAVVSAACGNDARMVLLSTDKAVVPSSVMGATKQVGRADRPGFRRSGSAPGKRACIARQRKRGVCGADRCGWSANRHRSRSAAVLYYDF